MRTDRVPELDVDYAAYEALKASGLNAAEVCSLAAVDGKDWAFQIRMLREIFDFEIAEARNIMLTASQKKAVE